MACPYFDPGERLPVSSGSLGDLYSGHCKAAAGSAIPAEDTLAERCNIGYARDRCPNFPPGDGPDAVRFSIAALDANAIHLLYAIERNHRPFSNGTLDYSTESGAFAGAQPEALQRLAHAYVRSYLRRTR